MKFFISLLLCFPTASAIAVEDSVGAGFFASMMENAIGNGTYAYTTYDPETYSIEEALRQLKADWKEGNEFYSLEDRCGYIETRGVVENRELLEQLVNDEDMYMESAVADVFFDGLFGYNSEVDFVDIVSLTWDGESGESEYCSIYVFEMLTTNGQRIYIEVQNTD